MRSGVSESKAVLVISCIVSVVVHGQQVRATRHRDVGNTPQQESISHNFLVLVRFPPGGRSTELYPVPYGALRLPPLHLLLAANKKKKRKKKAK